MKTILEAPLFGLALISLLESKRITKDLFDEAMADPKLAKMIVTHEAMHDYYLHSKEPTIFAGTDPKDRVPDSIPKHLKDRVFKLDIEPSKKAWKKYAKKSK